MDDARGRELQPYHVVVPGGKAVAQCHHRHHNALNLTWSRYRIAAEAEAVQTLGAASAGRTIAGAATACSDAGIAVAFLAREALLT